MLWFASHRRFVQPDLDFSWETLTQKKCITSTVHLLGSKRPYWRSSARNPLDVHNVNAGSWAPSPLCYTTLPAPSCSSRLGLGVHTWVTHRWLYGHTVMCAKVQLHLLSTWNWRRNPHGFLWWGYFLCQWHYWWVLNVITVSPGSIAQFSTEMLNLQVSWWHWLLLLKTFKVIVQGQLSGLQIHKMCYNTGINDNMKHLKQPIRIRICKMCNLDHKNMQVKVSKRAAGMIWK